MIWIILLTFLILIMVGVVAFDSNRFVIREITLESDKVQCDTRFLFISDLHGKTFGKENRRLFKALDGLDFDACVLAGDIMTADRRIDFSESIRFLDYLNRRKPVFYSLGNHESRSRVYLKTYRDLYDRYCSELNRIGVSMLDNGSAEFNGIRITGLTLPEIYYNKRKRPVLKAEEIRALAGSPDPSVFNLLLAHDPEYFEAYGDYGPDLVLAGHFHGGIVRLFGHGLISPRFTLFPKYTAGLYELGHTRMLVNRGLGGHHIPWRLFNPGEIILLNIRKK